MTDEERKALTERQVEVARLVADGYSPKQIAGMLTPPITARRVLVLITAAVVRLNLTGRDDRLTLALWWRAHEDQQRAA